MKWSFASVGLIAIGLIGVSIIMLFEQITTGNENDYYLLKEITESAMIDSIDITYYRQNGDLKIIREKFVENFARRFAESTNLIGTNYTINYYDIIEVPPKVTVSINTGLNNYTVGSDTSDYNVHNTLTGILEFIGKETMSLKATDNPYKTNKEYKKHYYSSVYKKDNNNVGTVQQINLPEELKSSNIKNVRLKYIDNKNIKIVTSQEEFVGAILRRSIDYPQNEDLNLFFNANNDTIIKNIDIKYAYSYDCNAPNSSNDTYNYECNKGKYWIRWGGVANSSNANENVAVIKYELTWSYDEYEYLNQ